MEIGLHEQVELVELDYSSVFVILETVVGMSEVVVFGWGFVVRPAG